MRKNPFTETLMVEYIRVIKRDAPERRENLHPGDYFDVEQTPATRVYRSKQHFSTLLDLSAPGLKLYLYLLYFIPDDAVSIRLDEADLCMLFECSSKTMTRMKAEIIASAILAKRQGNEYWINPRFFAADSRIKLYPENTVLKAIVRERSHGYDAILRGL